jgi:hypothetical protein
MRNLLVGKNPCNNMRNLASDGLGDPSLEVVKKLQQFKIDPV